MEQTSAQAIIIDGHDLTAIKMQMDNLQAEITTVRNSIKQGSVKFIADNIEIALKAVAAMQEANEEECDDDEDADAEDVKQLKIKTFSQIAYDALSHVKFVSEVSGVSYSLPHGGSSYCNGDGEPISSILDEEFDVPYGDKKSSLSELYYLVSDMEIDVQEWNSSYC